MLANNGVWLAQMISNSHSWLRRDFPYHFAKNNQTFLYSAAKKIWAHYQEMFELWIDYVLWM